MKVYSFYEWELDPAEAIRVQEQLRAKVIPHGRLSKCSRHRLSYRRWSGQTDDRLCQVAPDLLAEQAKRKAQ
ncbi:MAG: hypothetical protein OEY86_03595 [Nitrospira sp.]|nr:hypothetical protein [Nitrospira sp.]